MADQRSYIQGFDLDSGAGTDLVQGVAIVAAGAGGAVVITGDVGNGLDVDVTRVTGTVTVDTELPTAATLADNAANPTAPAVGAFGMVWDGATWDRLAGNSADGALVNLGANNDVTVTGTVTVDTEMLAAATLGDATVNPSAGGVAAFLMGFNGTTWDRVDTANTGRLQVDVITGGGAETPTNPANDYVTSAALAAGSTANLDSAEAAAKKLTAFEVWSSVPIKVQVWKLSNGADEGTEPMVIGGAQAFDTFVWRTPHKNYAVGGTASAGVDGFRCKVTNLDDAQAADVYVTYHWED